MRSGARTFLLLFAFALAVRLAVGLVTGLVGPPVEDERGYFEIARSLAEGRGFSLPLPPEFADVAPRTAFRAPLWPIALAPFASGGVVAVRIVAIVIGALAPPLLWVALRRTSLRDVAVWPAAALAVWPPAVYVSIRVLSEPLAMGLVIAAIAVAARPGHESGGHRGPPLRTTAISGILLGLAVLTRPAALLPALLIAAARRPRQAVLCVVVCLVTIAPWVVRNALLHGRPLLTTNTGVTLVGGNSLAAAEAPFPGKWVAPEVVYRGSPEAPELGMWGWRGLPEEASDRRFTRDALDFVSARPGDAAALALHKLVRFVDPDTHSAKDDAGLKRIVGWLTAAPAFLLAAIGLVRARRDASLRPYAWLLAGVLATCVVFYADARMRGAADPAILVFAAAALARRPASGVHEPIG